MTISGDHHSAAARVGGMVGGTSTIAQGVVSAVSMMIHGDFVVGKDTNLTFAGMVRDDAVNGGGRFSGPGLAGGQVVQR